MLRWIRSWLATDLYPHAHGNLIHRHVWGQRKHTHRRDGSMR